ncbi:MAG: GGDEF domain-containing protein [Anaerostipes sp.]|jgi:diguanylate cyclase (GGDEF)-like protein|nr:GGDEF domain-containing protein [Anaerostipes sp.]
MKTESILSIKDYGELKERWQHTHMHFMFILTAFIFLLEICMVFYLDSHELLACSIPTYIVKYLLIPSGINLAASVVGAVSLRISIFSEQAKAIILSVLFTIMCFSLATVHGFFSPVFGAFIVAILMTIVYEDWRLTTLILVLSGLSFIGSYLFRYDNARDYVNNVYLDLFIGELILVGVWLLSITIIRFEVRKRELVLSYHSRQLQLEEELIRDQLTGVYNKAIYDKCFQQLESSREYTCYLMMIDVDNFKQLNDTKGHLYGDYVLTLIGNILNQRIRQDDIAFRFGGDEFSVMCFSVTEDGIIKLAKRIQKDLEDKTKDDYKVSLSIGIAKYTKGTTKEELMNCADQALYRAKAKGKKKGKSIVFY